MFDINDCSKAQGADLLKEWPGNKGHCLTSTSELIEWQRHTEMRYLPWKDQGGTKGWKITEVLQAEINESRLTYK